MSDVEQYWERQGLEDGNSRHKAKTWAFFVGAQLGHSVYTAYRRGYRAGKNI